MVINKRRDVENSVGALLREAWLKVGTPSRNDFATRVGELVTDDPVLAALAGLLLSVIDVMTREVDRLTKCVLDEVRIEPTSDDGAGCRAIHRPCIPRNDRSAGSLPQIARRAHLGLTPRRYRSGETDMQGRISRCGDEPTRTALYEAAHSLLIRSTKWSALRAWGMNIAKCRGMARARVAVARKLAVILHRIWADGSEFGWGKQAAVPATA